jgi:predicted membrane GTPase involved in stress response
MLHDPMNSPVLLLDNIIKRSQGDGNGIQLEAPLKTSLERAIEYISSDEYVEATPKSLRLRKRILDATARKRAAANVALAPAVAVPAAAI